MTRAHFVHRDTHMDYRLYSPKPVNRPAPLLVLLHGCTQDSEDFAVGTDMDSQAATAGIHVLYPSQSATRNLRKCWNWFEPAHQQRGSGEVATLHALTAEIASHPDVDESRVFVAGMSAGGAMALVLADQYPESFSAVGVHSGLPCNAAQGVSQALAAMRGERSPTSPPTVKSSVPLIVFHGSADPVVHPSNATHIVAARTAHESITVTTHAGQCNGRRYKRHLHCTGEGRVVCEHWDLIGGAHHWSGGNPKGSHTVSNGPDASAEMLRFFMDSVPGL